jgi:hypothetical protein
VRPVAVIFGIAIFDGDILALDKSGLLKALAKCSNEVRRVCGRCHSQKPNDRHCGGLSLCGKRPRANHCCASQKRSREVTPSHYRPVKFASLARLRETNLS